MPKELYFIAIIPPQLLAEKLRLIKQEIANKYKAFHSLKVPEHVTVIPPFSCEEQELEIIMTQLEQGCSTLKPFELLLRNFGHFRHKVLFINARSRPETALTALYHSAKNLFEEHLSFINLKLEDEYHPHLTIANRDLKQSAFRKAWVEFKEREFEATFLAQSLFILNHPNNIWKPFREFMFANKQA